MKPLSAVCGLCSGRWNKDTAADTKAAEGMCGAMFQMISKSSDFAGFQSLPDGLISAEMHGSNVKQVKESAPVTASDSVHSGRKSRPLKGFFDLRRCEITVP